MISVNKCVTLEDVMCLNSKQQCVTVKLRANDHSPFTMCAVFTVCQVSKLSLKCMHNIVS